mmetsp:Transcript_25513/g.101677  ORF Transcript_25513/g.101677 Transcript_25513/m.101677 type:complete len:438 (+) Transcript_25513:92-1405(+)
MAGVGPQCYGFGRVLGEGAFAHVVLARCRSDGHDVAIKVMLKSHIEREGKHRAVMSEQRALRKCADCRHVVRLERTFQDEDYLFLVLEYAAGGDLLKAMAELARPEGGVGPAAAAFYAAEIWLGLRFLHDVGLAHRDVKPENVLLDKRGRVKLADFGAVLDVGAEASRRSARAASSSLSTVDDDDGEGGGTTRRSSSSVGLPASTEHDADHRRGSSDGIDPAGARPSSVGNRRRFSSQLSERHGSFEGTAEYVSPEVLQGEPTTTACDLWALGCVVFQLATGELPFQAATDFLLWEKILAFAEGRDADAIERPATLTPTADDLTRRLLVKDGPDRLGATRPDDFERHAFFAGVVDFDALRRSDDEPGPTVAQRAAAASEEGAAPTSSSSSGDDAPPGGRRPADTDGDPRDDDDDDDDAFVDGAGDDDDDDDDDDEAN